MSVTDEALSVVAAGPMPDAAAPMQRPPQALFTADGPDGARVPDPRAAFLADLALHRAAATPLCVGLFGPSGSGKSTLLAATLEATRALGAAADAAGGATPFQAGAATLDLEVEPGRDPYLSLLRQAHAGLAAIHPALVAEAAQALQDPHAAAREADDTLSAARHRLDAERHRLDDLSARQARLADSVLFEGVGTRLDAYARRHRSRIDGALRRFGFTGDTTVAYKELVRDAAEPGLGRGLGWLSAFWAYRGQLRLLGVAVGFFVAAWLVGSLLLHADDLLAALRSSGDKAGATADWLGAHRDWLSPLRQVLGLAGFAALAMNVLRGMRFIQPVARGATLLRGDLDGRRRDLDGLVAHQAQRVEGLAREVELAGARVAEAGRRLSAGSSAPAVAPVAGSEQGGPAVAARSFFASLSAGLARPGAERAPARLVVALDGFERLQPQAAAAFLEAAHHCLARPGFVTLLAADRDHLASGLAEADPAAARDTLGRIVQVPVACTGGDPAAWPGARPLVQALLGSEPVGAAPARGTPDAARSAFDKPWLPKEAAVLEALAPFAGGTPRAVKRFVNLYRIARADPALTDAAAADLATLALGLALSGGEGFLPASSMLGGSSANGEWQAARHAAATALGVALELGRDSKGLAVARRYGQFQ